MLHFASVPRRACLSFRRNTCVETAAKARRMANSRFEYVKDYELPDPLLPGCWIVVRVDGKGFTRFSELHGFVKPNDKQALDLMDECAKGVLAEFPDVRLGYGESDEYSFIIHKAAQLYGRRSSKITSLLTSCFTALYVRHWQTFFPDKPLQATPMFDGRAVCYPSDTALRDYLAWRQTDTHINNQYNTCFWALVQQGGCSPAAAQEALKGTDAAAKNELLYSRFGINYNELPEQFKKGSVVLRQKQDVVAKEAGADGGAPVVRSRSVASVLHCDIIRDKPFWKEHAHLLAP
ncbi:histidine tRNA 5'-guanylyltransferase [Haematococcus lacustris]